MKYGLGKGSLRLGIERVGERWRLLTRWSATFLRMLAFRELDRKPFSVLVGFLDGSKSEM